MRGPARGCSPRAAARTGKRAPESNGEDEDESARAESGARENAGSFWAPLSGRAQGGEEAPSEQVQVGRRLESRCVQTRWLGRRQTPPGPPKQAMNMDANGVSREKSSQNASLEDLARDPNSSIDPDLDIIPVGPPAEDEAPLLKLRKKRSELVIEEKEWSSKTRARARTRWRALSSTSTPWRRTKSSVLDAGAVNTVSDLLSQYVQVYAIQPGAPGYEQAFEFLCMGDDEDDEAAPGGAAEGEAAADAEGAKARGRPGPSPKRDATIDISQVDDIIRALVGEDDSDSEDEDDEDEADLRSRGGVCRDARRRRTASRARCTRRRT